MTAESRHINPEETLVDALARGESMTRAGRLCGKSLSTVRRRMQDPEFKQAVQSRRRAMLEESSAALQAAGREAVTTLKHLLTGESETVRLQAARSILELSVKLRDSVELEARVAALEEGRTDADS